MRLRQPRPTGGIAVHKNMKQMMRLGQHLTSSFDVPSGATRRGSAKKKHKKYKHRCHEQTDMPEDLEDPDHGDSDFPEDFEDTDSGEMERLLEDSIENEFRMGSPSIANAVGRMPSYYLLAHPSVLAETEHLLDDPYPWLLCFTPTSLMPLFHFKYPNNISSQISLVVSQ